MTTDIEDRVRAIAHYIIANNSTVRETAKVFKISKSTVHKDITERLSKININLYKKARAVLNKNKAERHLRGGLATKNKYMNMKKGCLKKSPIK